MVGSACAAALEVSVVAFTTTSVDLGAAAYSVVNTKTYCAWRCNCEGPGSLRGGYPLGKTGGLHCCNVTASAFYFSLSSFHMNHVFKLILIILRLS